MSPTGRRRLAPSIVVWAGLLIWSVCLVGAAVISPSTIRFADDHDLWAHAVGYGVHGALMFAALRRSGCTPMASTGLAIVVSSAFGSVTEGLQMAVPGRDPSLADVVADTIGAAVGAVASLCFTARPTDDRTGGT